jgi:hypothetical protein
MSSLAEERRKAIMATPAPAPADPKLEAELQKGLADRTQAAIDAKKAEYEAAMTDSAETDETVIGKVKGKVAERKAAAQEQQASKKK